MPGVQVNDIEIYYERQGAGEPLTLICGLGMDLSEMDTVSAPLAQHYQVIAFDNRGAGRTSKPDQPYTIEQMAEDTAGLLSALGIARTHLLGVSMGGRIALAFTLAHPERVERLALVSTAARVGKRPWWFKPLTLLSSGPLFRSKYPQPRYAFLRQLQASGAYDCVERLGEIHVPTLILHGRNDKTAPYALAEELHAGIADSQLLTFPGGHIFFLFRERQRFLDAVLGFLGK